jgi:hypothetical protein
LEWDVETVKLSVKMQGYSIGQKLQRNIVEGFCSGPKFLPEKKATKILKPRVTCLVLQVI